MKSANKLWKESGTTLSFKEWIDRENKKKEPQKINFESNRQDIVKDTINASRENVHQLIDSQFPDRPDVIENKTLGLNNKILIISGALILTSIGIYFYKKYKK